jgi:hypothetical protein
VGMEVNGTKRLKGKSPNIKSTFILRFIFIRKMEMVYKRELDWKNVFVKIW